jgi:uncharacterized membrane protein HdeD (DUF308 family)
MQPAIRFNESVDRGDAMKTAAVVGVILIVLGIVSLAYQGITYTTHKKIIDIGPLHATQEQHKTIPLPPLLGAMAFMGGVALVVAARKET